MSDDFRGYWTPSPQKNPILTPRPSPPRPCKNLNLPMYQLVSCHLGLLNRYTASICELKFERAPKVLLQSSSQILPFSSTLVMIAYKRKVTLKIQILKWYSLRWVSANFMKTMKLLQKLKWVQKIGRLFRIFVAFSEYLNFTDTMYLHLTHRI